VLSRLQSLLADEGRAFLLLGWDGRIGQSTPHGRDLLHEFFEDGRQMDKPSLPEALRDRLHQRLTGDGNALPQDSFPLTVERGGKKLRATLTESGDPTMPLMLELEELPAKLSAATLRPLGLSRRQSEVLALVATGATNNEIAVLLNVSPRTVKKHLEHIYDRLGVRTRTSAATIALQARHH
jgi:DNA-binding CsgD family transcriptional regulator